MQKFIIGTDNFGIGKVTCKIDSENSIINDLTIIGNEEIFEELSADENGKWNWALYPPKLYLRKIPFNLKQGKIEVAITEEILDEYDVALYLMEHNDIYGTFTIDKNKVFLFEGITYISGKEMKLVLEVNLTAYV